MSDSADDDGHETRALVEEIRTLARRLTVSLPEGVDLLQLSEQTKTAAKVQLIREASLWRQEEITRTALLSYEQGDLVVPAMLTRAAMETAALIMYVSEKVERALSHGATAELDVQLSGILTGSKSWPETPGAVNVLTLVDRVTKKIDSFRQSYDFLSEATHPNWAGTHGAYSKLDRSTMMVSYSRRGEQGENKATGVLKPLAGSLELFIGYYEYLGDMLLPFARVCDRDLA